MHFNHIVPFSKVGTSLKAENIQLLCACHNLREERKDSMNTHWVSGIRIESIYLRKTVRAFLHTLSKSLSGYKIYLTF
ncbi:hypothetical protein EVC37_24360 [Methylocaldum sp. BRCS4]|nr:hypothetical protein [Methylocaldum sp. BRCS4]